MCIYIYIYTYIADCNHCDCKLVHGSVRGAKEGRPTSPTPRRKAPRRAVRNKGKGVFQVDYVMLCYIIVEYIILHYIIV